MPLRWNLTEVENWQQLHESDEENVITDAIINLTQTVKIDKITAENYREFYFRMYLLSHYIGGLICTIENDKKSSFNPSLVDIKRRIGLSTNADNYSNEEWNAWIGEKITGEQFREKIIRIGEHNPDMKIKTF